MSFVLPLTPGISHLPTVYPYGDDHRPKGPAAQEAAYSDPDRGKPRFRIPTELKALRSSAATSSVVGSRLKGLGISNEAARESLKRRPPVPVEQPIKEQLDTPKPD